MITVDGVRHKTISDAAQALGVSVRTVDGYIDKGIIPDPPVVDYGLREMRVFPDDFLERAKRSIAAYRARHRSTKRGAAR